MRIPVLVALLLATPALAQQLDPHSLIGKTVVGAEGEEVGAVAGVVVTGEGRPRAIVIEQGGILGLGEQRKAVTWSDVRPAGDDQVAVTLTEEQVSALPDFDPETWK